MSQGQFLGSPSLLPFQSLVPPYYAALIPYTSLLPRLRFPYEQDPSSLPTLSLRQCLVQKAYSLNIQTSKKHKIREAEERENGNPCVFWGKGPPMLKCNAFAMFDGNATEGRVVFQPGSCFFCPWGLSLGIIWWLGWWESRGRPGLARVEQSRLQASLCRNVFRGTLEQASTKGRSFTFVCRKKYFLSRKKISTLISHPFQDAFTADYRQTNGHCLGRQTVWSDIAQWNHMVPPVTLIIHFC